MGVERGVFGNAAIVDVVDGEVGFKPFGLGVLGKAHQRVAAVEPRPMDACEIDIGLDFADFGHSVKPKIGGGQGG